MFCNNFTNRVEMTRCSISQKHEFSIMRTLFVLLMFMCSAQKLSAYDAYVDGIYYNLDNDSKTATVTYNLLLGTDYRYRVLIIPEQIEYNGTVYSVTSIGDYAFYGSSSLTEVIIPSSVTTIGEEAFYNCRYLKNVFIPNGVSQIGGSAFYRCSALTEITIPSSITAIGRWAFGECKALTKVVVSDGAQVIGGFSNCTGLTEITIPNSVTKIGSFSGCSGLTEITIPSSVIMMEGGAFKNCSNLKKVTISDGTAPFEFFSQPFEHQWFSGCPVETLYLGRDINDYVEGSSRYVINPLAGMKSLTTLIIGEQVTKLKYYDFKGCESINSITSYIGVPAPMEKGVFEESVYNNAILNVPLSSMNLYQTTKGWNEFKNIVPLGAGGGTSVDLNVIDENNKDITSEVSVVWCDRNGSQIGTGSRLSGVVDSTEVYYTILLDEVLGRVYREVKAQGVIASGDTIICQLEKIGEVTLEGRVSATDIEKMVATVNVKQMLNGKYEETFTVQTNERGEFSVTVFDDETDITVSREDCFDVTLRRDGFNGNGNIGVIPLSLIYGSTIAANITYFPAVVTGETRQETVWSDGLNNIEFVLTNKTKGGEITDFVTQNGNLIIKTGADIGDEISLIAHSKKGIFADATTGFTIKESGTSFDLLLTELGGFNAVCAGSNNGGTTGYLYDSNGVLAGKGNYVGETLSMRHLPDGAYTLVSMGRSPLLANLMHLTDLADVGLSEGKDYVVTRVEVIEGELAEVSVSEVPRLDSPQFYCTTGTTYFNANRPSVVIGDYVTMSARVYFKTEYADKVDDLTLIIDLPEGCQMVEHSAIANRQDVVYTINDNQITMSLTKEQWMGEVRFCVTPLMSQNYVITAKAQFNVDGQILQPIGTAQFEATGLSLNVPNLTTVTKIDVSGFAQRYSDISIYDNEVFVGKAFSMADGSWTANIELHNPYAHSFHNIYVKTITEHGLELKSETKQVEYDINASIPERVTMLYYNPEFDENYNIVFNLINGVTTPSTYFYFPYKNWPNWYETYETEPKDFTFLVDFTRNDTTQIKNVNLKVLNSDGTVRTLPTIFDSKQNKWVASTRYSSANRLPQNVTVEYNLLPSVISDDDREERILDQATVLANVASNIYQYYMDNVEMALLEDSEDSILLDCKFDDASSALLRIENMDYAEAQKMMKEVQFIYAETEEGISATYTTVTENEDEITVIAVDLAQNAAFRISMAIPSQSVASSSVRRARGNVSDFFTGGAGVILDIVGISNYLSVINDFDYMYDNFRNQSELFNKIRSKIVQKMLQKCSDGSFRLTKTQMKYFEVDLQSLSLRDTEYTRQCSNYIEEYKSRLRASLWTDLATLGIGKVIKGVTSTYKFRHGQVNNWFKNTCLHKFTHMEISASILSNTLGVVSNAIVTGTENILGYADFIGVRDRMLSWASKEYMEISIGYADLQTKIEEGYKDCDKKEEFEEEELEEEMNDAPIDEKSENKPEFIGKGATGLIDPSGYVYEAVISNRLEGVTVTCYQQTQGEDANGEATTTGVVWNAEDYSQQNPLKTDATGFYRWDVPQGMWQVKYELEGYETTYSDWLPVPPPQLDVNVGMKQSTPPTVEKMRGFESGITIAMGKYMRPETMTIKNITVTRNGADEKGSIELLNEEKDPLGEESYVSKVKFVPEMAFNTTDNVEVTVHQDVESYCGAKMTKNHVETVKIEQEIKSIVADSVLTIPYQGEKELRVQVLPKEASAGKMLYAKSSSSMIVSVNAPEAKIDENGVATFTLNGELLGGAVLNFTMEETDVTATSKVRVAIVGNTVATPRASIRSGETITADSLLTLSCETEGATIYYTLDGTCPCDEMRRMEYTAPITLPVGHVVLQAMAVYEGMEDSKVAIYEYTVTESPSAIKAIKGGYAVEAYYHSGSVIISGAEGASCRIYDLQGRELADCFKLGNQTRIRVPQTDVYLINVLFSGGKTVVCKVLAKD